ncbi:MAG: hypothetical protein U0N59_06355 [Oscillospiraceae bacterium]
MIEKEAFIAALLPICDTVCEYDRARGKLRVRKTSLASGLEDKWYTVEELRDIFRVMAVCRRKKACGCAILAAKTCGAFSTKRSETRAFACGSGRAA